MTSADAYRGRPDVPPVHDHAWTRMYRLNGRVAHIRELIYSAHPRAPSSWDSREGWYGTGSQDEYDRAKSLPACPHCFVIQVQYERELHIARLSGPASRTTEVLGHRQF